MLSGSFNTVPIQQTVPHQPSWLFQNASHRALLWTVIRSKPPNRSTVVIGSSTVNLSEREEEGPDSSANANPTC